MTASFIACRFPISFVVDFSCTKIVLLVGNPLPCEARLGVPYFGYEYVFAWYDLYCIIVNFLAWLTSGHYWSHPLQI